MNVTKITHCRLCDSKDLLPVFSLQPTPVGDYYMPKASHPEKLERYPLNVFLCKKCGHSQLDALVDPGEIYSKYLYTTSVSLGLAEHFVTYADTVCKKLNLAANSLVVDIGSNDGTLLRAFKQKGMRVLGVDPAKAIAERATASGIPTINAFFDPTVAATIRREHGGAALVIANNVVANVPNPSEFVRGVSVLLSEQGHFVWETGYVKYLTEGLVFDNIHHEHIDYYAVRPLIEFYRKLGLALFDVEVSNSKGSSIRCYVARASVKRAVSPSVRSLIAHEEAQGYFTPAPYRRLTQKLEATRTELHRLITEWRKQGKTVAGYGAAIGVTTVLYQFDLGGLIDVLVDDNPVRNGLCSPGYAIPVTDSGKLSAGDRPDYVLILAWRYSDPIIARNADFLEKGGSFVRILPEIEIVTRESAKRAPASSPALTSSAH